MINPSFTVLNNFNSVQIPYHICNYSGLYQADQWYDGTSFILKDIKSPPAHPNYDHGARECQ